MVAGADVIAPPVGDNQMTNEGVCSFSAIWDIALLLFLEYFVYVHSPRPYSYLDAITTIIL